MLFLLIAGHALADFPLQSGTMATCKCRRADLPLQKTVPWYYWLTAHALVHGLVAGAIAAAWTGNRDLCASIGPLEAGAHWVIDLLKCGGYFGMRADQALHILCKVVWWQLAAHGVLA